MKKFKKYAASKAGRDTLLSFGIVIAGYIYLQVMVATGNISSLLESLLVPICAYVIMAVSLNLTVGILGELSLGHAGFMSVGAFAGVVTTTCLAEAIPSAPLRLAVAILVGGIGARTDHAPRPSCRPRAVSGRRRRRPPRRCPPAHGRCWIPPGRPW